MGTKDSKDPDTSIRWGNTSKPAFGGISFYIIFLASFAFYATLFSSEPIVKSFVGVLIASSLGFIIGLADDAYNTKPLLKLLGQILCGVVLVLTDNCIELFDSSFLNYSLTIFWVVGLMNSINMLDNMDGVTTVVSVGVILGSLCSLVIIGEYDHFYSWLLLGVLASLLGFLYFNWNPSKMYMGDTGSQFLGVFLAAISIYFFWNSKGNSGSETSELAKVIISLLAFLPSIVDTTVVVINRLLKKQSPFIGGKDHTTHHLSYLGWTDRSIAIFFFCLSVLSIGIGLYLNHYVIEHSLTVNLLSIVYCLVVFTGLFAVTKINKSKIKE